jgi:hypothetical protein
VKLFDQPLALRDGQACKYTAGWGWIHTRRFNSMQNKFVRSMKRTCVGEHSYLVGDVIPLSRRFPLLQGSTEQNAHGLDTIHRVQKLGAPFLQETHT